MKSSGPEIDAIAAALQARHGIDARGSLALRARLEQAVIELPAPASPRVPHRDEAFLDLVAQRLRVGETRFYRDPEQCDAIASSVVPSAMATGRCRVLSAGCSTGEEAYTMAMILAAADDGSGGSDAFDVTGIDVSAASIEVARRARYPREVAASLPSNLRRFVIERGDEVQVVPEVVARCQFVLGDLLSTTPSGPFHLILCRNVLIYLAEDAAARVLERLASSLTPGGVLVVARAEVQVARRAGLEPIAIGLPKIVAFTTRTLRASLTKETLTKETPEAIGPAPSSRLSRVPPSSIPGPPSIVRLIIAPGDAPDAIVARGQALLARGAALIEIQLSTLPTDARDPRLATAVPAIRRFVAAARAVGARCIAGSDATARALASLGVALE